MRPETSPIIWYGLVVVAAALSVGCPPEVGAQFGAVQLEDCGDDWFDEFDYGDVDCDSFPHLCDRPVERVDDSPVEADDAIHIAFVGDGFREQKSDPGRTVGSFDERVDELVEGLVADSEGIVGSRPDDFHLHRVDLGPHPEGDNRSLLDACVRRDSESSWLRSRNLLAKLAVRESMEREPEVVAVVLNSVDGRANADRRTGSPGIRHLRIRAGSSHRVLSHELGHALIGLGDEYGDQGADGDGECFECDESCRTDHFHGPEAGTYRTAPNVTIDPEGRRWSHVTDQVREGGDGYDCGVYHPGEVCRMESSSESRFCSVCRDAIDRRLRGFLDEPVPPLICDLSWGRDEEEPTDVALTVESASAAAPVEMERTITYEQVPSDAVGITEGTTFTLIRDGGWVVPDWSVGPLPGVEGVDEGVVARIELRCEDQQDRVVERSARFEWVDGRWTVDAER